MITLILFAAMAAQTAPDNQTIFGAAVTNCGDHICAATYENLHKPEPMDVPATYRRGRVTSWLCAADAPAYVAHPEAEPKCKPNYETAWTCKDKSRVLLTAEDGSKHCILFKGREAK